MFQKKRLGIVLAALLSSFILIIISGCSNSAVNKAVNNAKAFADQKNFSQAAQTLHSAERELGSNLGPKELKALSNAYSYIVIKIADGAKTEAESGNLEKAFADINSSNELINLPPTMSLSPEAIEATHSARREIAKKCLKTALNKEFADSVELFNMASRNTRMSITPEIQKIFDDARIKITEGPAIIIIKALEDKDTTVTQGMIDEGVEVISVIDSMDTSISNAQSVKVVEAKKVFQTRQMLIQTQTEIDTRLAQAEQFPSAIWPENLLRTVARKTYETIAEIYNNPVYSKAITENQKRRYNAIVISLNEKIKKETSNPSSVYSKDTFDKYILTTFPIQ